MDGDLIVSLIAAASAATSAIFSAIAARQASKAEHLATRDYLDVLQKMVRVRRETRGENSN